MKHLLLILLLTIYSTTYSQTKATTSVVTKSYKALVDIYAQVCDSNGNTTGTARNILSGSFFTVIDETTGGQLVVSLWKYTDTVKQEQYNMISASKQKIYFLIEEEDISKCVEAFNNKGVKWSGGSVIIPIKLRNDPFDFSKDFTVGPALSMQKRLSRTRDMFFNLTFTVGISSVTFDSLSTEGVVAQPRDVAAFSYAIGALFETNAFQFGVFVGRDRVSDGTNENWIYNDKTWWSIGLGYTIFSQSKKGADQKTPNQ